MSDRNNDIVNGNVSRTSNYISNDNIISDRYVRARRVENIADSLLDKLGLTTESRPFMCKVAWKLSEARIWDNYEQAQKAKTSKVGLFIFLCKRDGV